MIKAIGFDLDQTLYPKSPEIDAAIQQYIFERIAEHKRCSVDEGRRLFQTYYPKMSGRETLKLLGLSNPADIIQEALERADIAKFLRPDPLVISFLEDVRSRFRHVALITGSHESNALQKLAKLGIPLSVFDFFAFGDKSSKRGGGAFKEWLDAVRDDDPLIKPSEFLYVGDRPMSDVDPVLALGMKAVLVNVKKKDESVKVEQFSSLLELKSYLFG